MDGVVLAIVILWAVRGFRAGTLAQVFSLAGLFAGLVVAVLVEKWVGARWLGARPAVVFWVLRWLVALLAGGAVAALLQWWGESTGKIFRQGPLGWLDGLGGAMVGAAVGVVFSLALLVLAVRVHTGREVAVAVANARTSLPLVRAGLRITKVGEKALPGRRWIRRQLEAAELGIISRRSS